MKHALLTLIGAWLIGSSSLAQWTENFEDNWAASWYADNGTWTGGAPTWGPGGPYSGASCAGTVLTGDYPPNIDTRWVRHVDFTVPNAELNPRLRFWHWYSFSWTDYGEVQLSTDQGDTWTTISPNYTWSGSGVWTQPVIDLRSWADSTVRIAFLLHAHDDVGHSTSDVSSGWYIDNLEFVADPIIFNVHEGFELDVRDWCSERGTWEIGGPTSGPGSAYTDSTCAATVLAGNYAATVDSRLISPEFHVPSADWNTSLTFWHWYSFSYHDYGEVYIRTRNNQVWTLLTDPYQFVNNTSIWTNYYIPLTDYADSTVQIAFFFHADDDVGHSGSDVSTGWYIDDVFIDSITTAIIQPKRNRIVANPCPFSTMVTLTLPSADKRSVLVADAMGMEVCTFQNVTGDHLNWDGRTTSGTEVPPGMYLVTVIADGQRYTQRVVKQ